MKDRPTETDAALTAVTPIDGRYRARTRRLEAYFSEFALIRYRVRIEIEWYLSLAAHPAIDALKPIPAATAKKLRAVYEDFTLADARRVKELEATTNHDVKAVEYFLKERVAAIDPALPLEMVHFACTSEDISNLAYALILKEFVANELTPRLEAANAPIVKLAHRYKSHPMIARTHGQEASPTTVGKEMAIFASRLERQLSQLRRQEYLGKLNGAVGNFNAHHFAYPEVDWIEHSRSFVERLGLIWNPLTTQIESHDFIAELFAHPDAHRHDPARLLPRHVGLHLDRLLRAEDGRGRDRIVGDAAQGQSDRLRELRGQPRYRERAVRASGGQAAGLAMAARSDGQHGDTRDGHGVRSSDGRAGVAGTRPRALEVNEPRIAEDLEAEKAWEVVAEAIQTLMRRHGLPKPYETLKELTRGRRIDRRVIEEFIATLPLDDGAACAARVEAAELRRAGGEAGRAIRAPRKPTSPWRRRRARP